MASSDPPTRRPDSAFVLGLSGLDHDGLAAAASFRLVRILEDEPRGELLALVVHLRPDQEHDRLGIDENSHALALHDLIDRADRFRVVHRVTHAGTAAILHSGAHTDISAVGLPHDVVNPGRSGIGQTDHLRAFAAGTCIRRCGCGHLNSQNMFNSSFASSDMRSGVHGGSKVMFTFTSRTPLTVSMALLTIFGISPATGQPGAVRVISMVTSLLSATSTL